MKRHHEQTFLLYFSGFPGWLARFSPQMNNKMHFSLAKANNSANFERKMVWKWRFLLIHKQQTNMWMKLRTIPTARVSGQDRKITPALETNQIAGFGGFNPLASLEKKHKTMYSPRHFWSLFTTMSNALRSKENSILVDIDPYRCDPYGYKWFVRWRGSLQTARTTQYLRQKQWEEIM